MKPFHACYDVDNQKPNHFYEQNWTLYTTWVALTKMINIKIQTNCRQQYITKYTHTQLITRLLQGYYNASINSIDSLFDKELSLFRVFHLLCRQLPC